MTRREVVVDIKGGRTAGDIQVYQNFVIGDAGRNTTGADLCRVKDSSAFTEYVLASLASMQCVSALASGLGEQRGV
jgi:hypothetical protein